MALLNVTFVKSSMLPVRRASLEDAYLASSFSINFFYKNSSREQWNYVCNFLHDLFRLHYRTKEFFKDVSVPIRSSIIHSCFIVSLDEKKTVMTSDEKKENILYVRK